MSPVSSAPGSAGSWDGWSASPNADPNPTPRCRPTGRSRISRRDRPRWAVPLLRRPAGRQGRQLLRGRRRGRGLPRPERRWEDDDDATAARAPAPLEWIGPPRGPVRIPPGGVRRLRRAERAGVPSLQRSHEAAPLSLGGAGPRRRPGARGRRSTCRALEQGPAPAGRLGAGSAGRAPGARARRAHHRSRPRPSGGGQGAGASGGGLRRRRAGLHAPAGRSGGHVRPCRRARRWLGRRRGVPG